MELTVGQRSVPLDVAESRVIEYVTSDAYLFTAYDTYRTSADRNRLSDGDLLAPALLNVNVKPRAYRKLSRWRPAIEKGLSELPDVSLRHASDVDLAKVAACFRVLNGESRMGVTLAKVLHRKRPGLLPLYDRNVDRCYLPGRIPRSRRRNWSEFFELLAREMRADLQEGGQAWGELCAAANDARGEPPELTELRALDILAWWPESASS